MSPRTMLILGAIAAATAAAFWLKKKGLGAVAVDVGAALGGAAVDVASGVVIGAGEAVGIPRTNMTECERAMAEGRTWDASFACPAKTFLGYVTSW